MEQHRDQYGWMLDPSQVQDIGAAYGPFTVDTCAHSLSALHDQNAQVVKFYSSHSSFLRANVQGERMWLNVPFRRLGTYLEHYNRCKECSPTDTSAIIIAPRWENKEWWKCCTRMRVIEEFPAGSKVMVHPLGNTPCP